MRALENPAECHHESLLELANTFYTDTLNNTDNIQAHLKYYIYIYREITLLKVSVPLYTRPSHGLRMWLAYSNINTYDGTGAVFFS